MTLPWTTVAFDLGGVLVDVDRRPFTSLFRPDDLQAVFAQHDALQTGACTPDQFFAAAAIRSDADEPSLLAAWRSMVHFKPQAQGWLDAVAARGLRTVFWSNTDPVHAGALGLSPERGHALSFAIGANKPDVRFFARALTLCGAAPGDVLFLDDREENVRAAENLGIDAQINVDAGASLRQRGLV